MTAPLDFRVGDLVLVVAEKFGQHLTVHGCDEFVHAAVHHLDPFPSHRIR